MRRLTTPLLAAALAVAAGSIGAAQSPSNPYDGPYSAWLDPILTDEWQIVIRDVPASDLQRAATELGLQVIALSETPSVKMHPAKGRSRRIPSHLAEHAG